MHWQNIKTSSKMNGVIKHLLQMRKNKVDNYVLKRIDELEKQNNELNELIRFREVSLIKLMFGEGDF